MHTQKSVKTRKPMILLVCLGLLLTLFGANKVAAYDPAYVHFEFRTYSPDDISWSQTKYTTSSYVLNQSTLKGISGYTATPYGKGGGKSRAVGSSVWVNNNRTYYLSNYLVENYGKGNAAWIHARVAKNGSAYGTWRADR